MTPKNTRAVREMTRPLAGGLVAISRQTQAVESYALATGARVRVLEAFAGAGLLARLRWLLTGAMPEPPNPVAIPATDETDDPDDHDGRPDASPAA